MTEFSGLIAGGNGPTRSAFLSAFFTLVGAHGLHVSLGMLWLLVMIAQSIDPSVSVDPLLAKTMPLIRYELGDLATMARLTRWVM